MGRAPGSGNENLGGDADLGLAARWRQAEQFERFAAHVLDGLGDVARGEQRADESMNRLLLPAALLPSTTVKGRKSIARFSKVLKPSISRRVSMRWSFSAWILIRVLGVSLVAACCPDRSKGG